MSKETAIQAISKRNSTGLIPVIQKHPLKFYAPANLSSALKKVHTVEDALTVDTDTIATLRRCEGEQEVEDMIGIHLATLNEYLQLRHPLSPMQMDEIASEIVSTYPQLTMADVFVIFRRAKTGYYGEFYERLSIPKVLTWFRKYFDERVSVAMELSEANENRMKDSNSFGRMGNTTLLSEGMMRIGKQKGN